MHRSIILLGTLLLAGLATAQVDGQANVLSGYASSGAYSLPGAPLVSTPSLTLGGTSFEAGASDSATGPAEVGEVNFSYRSGDFDFGAARSQNSYGAAALAAGFHPAKAAKVYTNQDVAQVNNTNGLAKFGGRTEHL